MIEDQVGHDNEVKAPSFGRLLLKLEDRLKRLTPYVSLRRNEVIKVQVNTSKKLAHRYMYMATT